MEKHVKFQQVKEKQLHTQMHHYKTASTADCCGDKVMNKG
jgi:hypothetical protein